MNHGLTDPEAGLRKQQAAVERLRQSQVKRRVSDAQRCLAEEKFAAAAVHLRAALKLDPEQAEARRLWAQLLAAHKVPKSLVRSDGLGVDPGFLDQLRVDTRQLLTEGIARFQDGQAQAARDRFERAEELLRELPRDEETNRLRQSIRRHLESLHRQVVDEKFQVAQRDATAFQKAKAAKDERVLQQLENRARLHLAARQYDLAKIYAEEIRRTLPQHAGAQFILDEVHRHRREARTLRRRREEEGDSIYALAPGARAKALGATRMPSPRSAAQPNRRAEAQPRREDWERELDKALQRPVSLEPLNLSLREFVGQLRVAAGPGVNIFLDPNVPQQDRILALPRFENMRLESVLSHLCRFSRDIHLKWALKDQAILLSTRERLRDESVLRTYPVHDLLLKPKNFLALEGYGNTSGRDAGTGDRESRYAEKPEPWDLGEEGSRLADFIRKTVSPDAWTEGEGVPAGQRNTIGYRGGKLIVVQSPDVHQKIQRLLESFREARALMVTIQARFIDVQDWYLERIGVNWGGLGRTMTITGVAAPVTAGFTDTGLSRLAGPPVLETDPPAGTLQWFQGHTPRHERIDLTGRVQNAPGITLGDSTWTDTGGLALQWSYLSDWQVSALIEAVVKRRRGNILTSPKITCFNTQRANIVVSDQVNYIFRINEDGAPEIRTVTDGIVLEVQPFVSANLRYVTLEMRPTVNDLVSLDPAEIMTTSGDEQTVVTTLPLHLPRISVRSIETTVSIPDGGTLLVGGLAQATQMEARAGIPIIEDIPFLREIFGSWGKSDVRSSLIILVRCDIIVQGEAEP